MAQVPYYASILSSLPLLSNLLIPSADVQGRLMHNHSNILSIPHEYTYLLPAPFDGNIISSFLSGTTTSDASINRLLQNAVDTPFISYDDEFMTLLGLDPPIVLVDQRDSNFAAEAGVWIPSRNEVWYTTWINDGPTHVEILDLSTYTVRNLTTTVPLENPNGGFYHERTELIYFACLRDDTRDWPGGVVSVDPNTGAVETVFNSYFGLKFDNIDDVAWVTKPGTNLSYMFITVLPYPEGTTLDNTLPQGLWRWDPQERLLLPALSRTEFPVANGVRASKDGKHLWLTDFGGEERSRVWGLPAKVGVPGIYRYELDEEMWPVNKRLFGVARMQAPDGIRIDDQGRVWTAEGEGVVVRTKNGKVIGLFNAHYFTRDPVKTAIVQFELAGDKVVILGQDKLWVVKVAEIVNQG